ncbi:hypothetical protein DUNSADRAFT_18356 [Dunaliella salina]|uniref:S5 DRBM domain-containing protein n=1 Tax=Dunaliella salina TaxID=3046 RepID=A0ABQ7G088_DUNSA|nr:hypothetical protein DUNSADRAFT_18356 [Dunaliella salina]|eukprot:KAF5828023.1 hypothetical protein DUNSADRAFT_18356 [Dunaliella salina]
MWRHAQRAARQAFNSFSSHSGAAFARASAAPKAASCGKAAMRAAAACNAPRAGGLASSPGFQSFKQGMGARSMMGFAASAPSVSSTSPSKAPSSLGKSSAPASNSSSVVPASGEGSDEDSASTSSGGDDDEEGTVKKRRTKARPKRGLDSLAATAAAVGPVDGAKCGSPSASIFFLGRNGSKAGIAACQWDSSASTNQLGRLQGAQVRALHTASPQLVAAGASGNGRRGGTAGANSSSSSSGSGSGMGGVGISRPSLDYLTENLIFAKESFLMKPEAAIPIPMPTREVMYQHRWDKLLVDVRRAVSYVRAEGKREQYTAMVAVGNMKGLFGLGLGDAPTAQEAVAAAYLNAFNKLITIPLYRGHTIFNHIEHRYNSLKFLLSPRQDGWGITANDLLLELCNLAGIRNISIKVYGRRRPKFYVAAGFLEALQHQTVPHDGVEGSGIYVREMLAPSARHSRAP